MKQRSLAIRIGAVLALSAFSAMPATAQNCEVKIDGVLIEAVSAEDRLDCYNQTSFGAANCEEYAAHLRPGVNHLEQFFNQTDRVNSDSCLMAPHETSEGSDYISLDLAENVTSGILTLVVDDVNNADSAENVTLGIVNVVVDDVNNAPVAVTINSINHECSL